MNAILARVSAILLGLLSLETPCADDGLGRLFWMPTERADLDRSRENISPVNAASTDESPLQTQAQTQVIVKGIVVRNDGQHAVWINDTSTVRDKAGVGTFGVTSQAVDANRITVRVGEQGHAVKPGQILFLDSGRVEEGYRIPPLPAMRPTTVSAEMPSRVVSATKPAEAPAVSSGTPDVAVPVAPILDALSRESVQ